MIEHEGRQFDDSKLRPYSFTKRLLRNYVDNECEVYLVVGMPEGIGKSAYVNGTLADIHGYLGEKDPVALKLVWEKKPIDAKVWDMNWEATKQYLMFPPDRVVDTCMEMLDREERSVAFHWEDAGTWLNAMDFNDPFVVAFMKYLSLARSNWGGVVLSSPVADWVLKKLRTAKGILHIDITKEEDRRYVFKPRKATCRKCHTIYYKGRKHQIWPRQFEDFFPAIMPDWYYRWYKPQRDSWAKIATQLMRRALEKRKERGWDQTVEHDVEVLEDVEKSIQRANDRSEDFTELVVQKSQETLR